MDEKKHFNIKKTHFNLVVLVLIFVVALLIVAPFLVPIISAYVLAFLLLPLFKKFNKRMGKGLSALLCIVLVLLIILVPVFFAVNQLVGEAAALVKEVNSSEISFSVGAFEIATSGSIWSEFFSRFTNFLGGALSSFPSVITSLMVTLFGVFYFLSDWNNFNSILYKKIPLENKGVLFRDVSTTTKRIAYGLFVVGILEALISFAGFTISGVKFPLIFAMFIGLLAFTLVIDPSVIWVPLALVYLLVLKNSGTALGILITGLVLSTDTFFRPKIVGSVSKINPFIMLIGVLGGISLFGVLGFIIGPIVLFFSLRLFKESVSFGE